jgi:hypothetical protein
MRRDAVVGTVEDAGGAVEKASVMVFGVNENTLAFSRFTAGTQSTADGRFSIGRLLPGMYFVAAVPASFASTDPAAVVAALRPFATPVQVSASGPTSVRLTLIKR